MAAAPPAARQRLDAGEAGLHVGVPGRHGRRQDRRHRSRAAADARRRHRAPGRAARRAALHRAAAALRRGLAGEGARGARHRPPLDLRHHHLDAAGSRVRGDGRRRFVPTDIGKIVCRFLTEYFHRYVEYGFTAAMEDELDAVSRGEEDWTTPLEKFWKPFINQVEKIEKTVSREQVAQARELGQGARHRQADHRAHGPLRPLRADRHQGRRGEAEVRRTAPRAEDGHDHPRRGDGAVQAAAHARGDRGRRDHHRQRRPLRPVREVRRQVRLPQGRRPVRGDARARAAR